MNVEVVEADFNNPKHVEHILFLTNTYAKDRMGCGKSLSENVLKTMIEGYKAMPTALPFLAYQDSKPIGVANCFWGYSTFYAKKLINIHDLGVVPEARGMGIGKAMIEAVVAKAKAHDCCKVTLEVLENNPAKRLYEREGFEYGSTPFFYMSKLLV